MTNTDHNTPKLTQAELEQFTGDPERFESLNPIVLFTTGVNFLLDRTEALWLINCISSWYTTLHMMMAIADDPRLLRCTLHLWTIVVTPDKTAVITARADSQAHPFFSTEIPYTDFPLQEICIWSEFDGRCWTLYLPSEH